MPFEDPNRPMHLKLWALTQMVDGWLGESNDALVDLESFWLDLQALELREEPRVIVTGDLTAFGHAHHFQRFSEFLGSGDGEGPALDSRDWLHRTISGNHDQWPGRPTVIGRRTPASDAFFAEGCDQKIGLAGDRVLRIIGIDTDADVGPCSRRRVFAIGDFRREIERLDSLLSRSPRPPQEIRVLLLHHSWSQAFGWRLHIAPGTKSKLGQLLATHQIQVLLSGHVHRASAGLHAAGESHQFLEARCGTTTQWDHVPKQDIPWVGGVVPRRQLEANTLMVHQVVEQGGVLWWETCTFVRRHGLEGFERDPNPMWTARMRLGS
jgi:hypothetical protein